jgi:hypothetical protein
VFCAKATKKNTHPQSKHTPAAANENRFDRPAAQARLFTLSSNFAKLKRD